MLETTDASERERAGSIGRSSFDEEWASGQVYFSLVLRQNHLQTNCLLRIIEMESSIHA